MPHQLKVRPAELAQKHRARSVLDEQAAFSGITRAHTSVMVCPELVDHVRSEVERESKLFKNLRLAREERETRRKNG